MTNDSTEHSFAGVDVGGTTIKLGWISGTGERLAELQIPTRPQAPPDDAVARIAESVRPWLESTGPPVCGIGLGTPGPLDLATGTFLTPVNLPNWKHFPIRDSLSRATGRPVFFSNDANAAAYGEYWLGSGRDFRSLVLLTLGTGVGSGIVIDDSILVGATGHAAECGHAIVDTSETARLCPCGQPGHLEAYASGTAVGDIATRLARGGDATGWLVERLRHEDPLTAHDVFQAAESGDALALSVVDATADYLVRGIVNIAFTVDPDLVLLGGAMNFGGRDSPTGKRFLNRIRDEVKKRVFSPIAGHLKIEFALLGSSAGWIGAAGLARRDYDSGKTNSSSR